MNKTYLAVAVAASAIVAGCASSGERTTQAAGSTATSPGGLRIEGGTSMNRTAMRHDVAAFETDDCVVYFDVDSAAIRDDQAATLDECAGFFKDNSEAQLRLTGHADERGDSDYNEQLGNRRAQAVMWEMTRRGVKPSQVAVASQGEDRPVIRGADERSWSRNRRVEFTVRTSVALTESEEPQKRNTQR